LSYIFATVPHGRCSCGIRSRSPNDNKPIDAVLDVVSRLFIEQLGQGCTAKPKFLSKPGPSNEYDCVWTYGTKLKLPNGSAYNVKVGQRYFLIQNFYEPVSGRCMDVTKLNLLKQKSLIRNQNMYGDGYYTILNPFAPKSRNLTHVMRYRAGNPVLVTKITVYCNLTFFILLN
jgi:hypothetical protein